MKKQRKKTDYFEFVNSKGRHISLCINDIKGLINIGQRFYISNKYTKQLRLIRKELIYKQVRHETYLDNGMVCFVKS